MHKFCGFDRPCNPPTPHHRSDRIHRKSLPISFFILFFNQTRNSSQLMSVNVIPLFLINVTESRKPLQNSRLFLSRWIQFFKFTKKEFTYGLTSRTSSFRASLVTLFYSFNVLALNDCLEKQFCAETHRKKCQTKHQQNSQTSSKHKFINQGFLRQIRDDERAESGTSRPSHRLLHCALKPTTFLRHLLLDAQHHHHTYAL